MASNYEKRSVKDDEEETEEDPKPRRQWRLHNDNSKLGTIGNYREGRVWGKE